FAARPMHLDPQFRDVLTNIRSRLNDRLVHFVLHLIDDRGRSSRHQLHHVRTQFARSWINDLEFFFDSDGKAVSHGVALRVVRLYWGPREVSYAPRSKMTLLR